MIRIIVDSGSSIKQNEKEKYGVDIIPLGVIFDGQEYKDGIDLSNEEFYHKLIDEKKFPKTSLPSLNDIEQLVKGYLDQGDQVIIITISSKISGTYNALKLFFESEKNVHVIDSYGAVGAIRLLVDEANRYKDYGVEAVLDKITKLIPKIRIMAIPEKLDYLCRGGRLSKSAMLIGNLLSIKPVIGFKDGGVSVITKRRGLKNAMKYIVDALIEHKCNKEYDIIVSYTYNKSNVDKLVEMSDSQFKENMRVYDDLDHAIACHWGPNAFGFVFVGD